MFSIKEIKKILKSNVILQNNAMPIDELLTDSRKLSVPKNALFFAISGQRLDGHNYIADLYKKGVRNFIVEKEFDNKFEDANIIQVKNAVEALQKIVQVHREKFNYPVIGVTGSNGKTIVKEWLHQCLHKDFDVVRSPKSYNSQIGVPLSVWNMNAKNNLAIFEAGISEPDEMDNLQKIIQPTIGVFTNIGSAHGQNFINDSHKVKEKLKLFRKAKLIIYCKDHTAVNQSITDFWSHTINDETDKPAFFSWSENVFADLKITKKKVKYNITKLTCVFKEQEIKFEVPFKDKSSIENAMHCICLMLYLEYTAKQINKKLKILKRIEMRLEQRKGLNNCIIINDTYNSDLESLRIALEFLAQQQQTDKRTVILSDILQSGIIGVDLYGAVVKLLQEAKVTKFIGIGKEIFHHKYLFEKLEALSQTTFYASTEAFLEKEIDNNFSSEAVLLKGARSFHFERINDFLEEKAHATVFEINLNAIVHNLQFFNSKLKPKTKIMAMVKAFAYGAGSYEIAKLLEFHRVDYLGVAYADEGIALRKAGIKLPIMVLNPEKRSFEAMIKHKLEPEIYSLDLLKAFAEKLSFIKTEEPFPIHINIDTGMKRLGFDAEEIEKLGQILDGNKFLKVASIFSHLAASDEKKWDKFTEQQITKFEKHSQELVKLLGYKPILHLCNSSGILRFENAHFNMVRLGLGMYGINSEYQKYLEPVGVLKSHISQIRKVKKGETVGYGRIGEVEKDSKIAIIAIGYSDGLNRNLSNGKGNVFIKGKKAPIIGLVCMDMCMIDVSAIENVAVGDEVEIFGNNIPVAEVAEQTSSITYEVLTSVSERVKRVFFVE